MNDNPKMEIAEQKRGGLVLSMIKSGVVALLLAVCYLAHWFPFDVIAVFIAWPAWLITTFAITAIPTRIFLPKYAPKAFEISGYIYYSAVSVYCVLIGYYVAILDPAYIAWTALYCIGLGLVLWRYPKRRLVVFPFFILLAVLLFRLPHPVFRVGWLLFVPFILPALIIETPKKIGRKALFYAALVVLLTMRLGHFYYGNDPSHIASVKTQPGIETVLAQDNSGADIMRRVGRQIRYAADNMAGTYTIIGGDGGTIALSKSGNAPKSLTRSNSADQIVYLPDKGIIVAGDYGLCRLVVIDDANMNVLSTHEMPGYYFTNMRYDPESRMVLTGDDQSRKIGRFMVEQMEFAPFVEATASRDAIFDYKTGRIIATTIRRIRWFDPETGERTGQVKMPCSQLRLAADFENRHLYASCFSNGELWRIDLDLLAIEKKIKLERGIRFLKLAEDKKTLFVSSYFKGNIFMISVPEMKLKSTIFAGSRVRTLHIAPGSDRLVFGSSLGVYGYVFR